MVFMLENIAKMLFALVLILTDGGRHGEYMVAVR